MELSVTVLFIIVITPSPDGGPIVPHAAQKGCLFPGEPGYSNMRQEAADGQRQVDTSKHCLVLSPHQTRRLPACSQAGPTVFPVPSHPARRDGCLQELSSAGSPAKTAGILHRETGKNGLQGLGRGEASFVREVTTGAEEPHACDLRTSIHYYL